MDDVLPYRRSALGRLALLALMLLSALGSASGQGVDGPKHYFNENQFEIPFDVPSNRGVRSVILHASTDGKNFQEVSTALPTKKYFDYTAKGEGSYYFIVQVEDGEGRKTPARIDANNIDLRVCIDKKPPEVKEFKPVLPREGEGTIAVDWEVSDDQALDLNRLRLDYRAVGGNGPWTSLKITPLRKAQFGWTPRDAGEYDVRLTAHDRAGNKVEKTIRARASALASNQTRATPGTNASRAQVTFVPSKTFNLEYEIDKDRIGPSKVKKVEVWVTRDTKAWRMHNDDAPVDSMGVYPVTVEKAGRYGFTLRPISGVGRAIPSPRAMEQPQIWVEVDETRPVVRVLGVTVGEREDSGTITVNYSATDQWLTDKPISVYYSKDKMGWTEIKKSAVNTGSVKIATKADGPLGEPIPEYEFYIKVQAVDEAGNVGEDVFGESIKVDLSEPIVKKLSVKGAKKEQ